jgi:hypothetical protein
MDKHVKELRIYKSQIPSIKLQINPPAIASSPASQARPAFA